MNEPQKSDKSLTDLLADELAKKLADDSKMVEGGWLGFLLALKLKDAPPDQLREMRLAFFAGAMHVFFTLMHILDPGQEPTEKDMQRMDKLHEELDRFRKEMEALAAAKE